MKVAAVNAQWSYSTEGEVRDFFRRSNAPEDSEYRLQHPSRSAKDEYALGVDLNCPYRVVVPGNGSVVINSFVKFDFPFPVTVWPRGRSDFLIGAGVIEESYVGPIYVKVVNFRESPLVLDIGDPLCQLVPQATPLRWNKLVYVEELGVVTARGEAGGISGVSVDDGVLGE